MTCALCGRELGATPAVVSVGDERVEICDDGLACRRTVLAQRRRSFFPVPCSTEDLVGVIADILNVVSEGDSFEGFLNYLMPMPPDDPECDFMVEARYRIGNSMGQGGMRMLGEIRDPKVDRRATDH